MGDFVHFHNTSMKLAEVCHEVYEALSNYTFQTEIMKGTDPEDYTVRQNLRLGPNSVQDYFTSPLVNDKCVTFYYDSMARTLEVRIKVDLIKGEVDLYPLLERK